jgi:phosphoglycolate phosphatase-like HAD superfamily hydrolase
MVLACFDLDGVLIDSEQTKLESFDLAVRRVLDPRPELLEEIRRYNAAQRGVPRRVKFEHCARLAGAPDVDAAVRRLLDEYAAVLADRLPHVGPMPGAREFVAAWPWPYAVVTSAPEEEARGHLRRLGFRAVDHLADGRTPKDAALRALAEDRRTPMLWFGDAQADADAGSAADVPFVALGPRCESLSATRVVARARDLLELRGREDELARAAAGGP